MKVVIRWVFSTVTAAAERLAWTVKKRRDHLIGCCLSEVQKWRHILTWKSSKNCNNSVVWRPATQTGQPVLFRPLTSVDIFTLSDQSSVKPRDGCDDVEIPADQQPVKYSEQLVCHRVTLPSQSLRAPFLPQSDHVDAPTGTESRGCSDHSWWYVSASRAFLTLKLKHCSCWCDGRKIHDNCLLAASQLNSRPCCCRHFSLAVF